MAQEAPGGINGETLPLLQTRKSGGKYDALFVEPDILIESTDSWLHITVGGLLSFLSPYKKKWLLRVYNVMVGNCFICIGIILLSKVKGWNSFKIIFPYSLPLNDWWFQLANLSLVLSYTISEILSLRICLFFACIFFALFGWFGLGSISPDCVLYNATMCVINFGYICSLLWERRYISFPSAFERIYVNIFKPIGVSRHVFELLKQKGMVRHKLKGTVLHHLDDNVTSMNILVQGEVNLFNRHGALANTYGQYSVIEGIEWCQTDLDPEGKKFEHQFVAKTDVVFVKWSRETLLRLLAERQDLKQSLRIMLGLNAAKTTFRLLNQLHLKTEGCISEAEEFKSYNSH